MVGRRFFACMSGGEFVVGMERFSLFFGKVFAAKNGRVDKF